jgi:hypothetical protein
MRRIYQEGIDRVYDTVPEPDGKRSKCDFIGFRDCSGLNNLPKHVSFKDLRAESVRGNLPFPIVNMTAHLKGENDPNNLESWLEYRVFEFTPYHFGSSYYGYWTNRFPMDYNRAISVSGAAFDSRTQRSQTKRVLLSALNFDLGYYIRNPCVTETGRFWRDLMPFPLYLFDAHYYNNLHGDKIYLADGGHCENLGAYSLIRRGCQTIVIMDAEWDPSFQFEAYHILKTSLHAHCGLDLMVPYIEDGTFAQTFCPVMVGRICKNNPNRFPREDFTINVVYIKLSIQADKLRTYPQDVAQYYLKTLDRSQFGQSSAFPQESTLDQSYNPKQVLAYHDLGRFIVNQYGTVFRHFLK